MGTISYIKNFIKDPKVASITPTSRFTIEKICRYMDFNKDLRILEYGPGDGVFTNEFLKKSTTGSALIVIETNKEFTASLQKINDSRLTVINGSAEHVSEIVKSQGWNAVDYIISGIPFSFLKDEIKHSILKQSAALITREGMFLGYQTSTHLKPILQNHFPKVTTEMEFRNIPPMCIYIAQK